MSTILNLKLSCSKTLALLLTLSLVINVYCQDTSRPVKDTSHILNFGLLPPTENELKQTPYSASFTLPQSFVLPRNVDLSGNMPLAGDQGCQGACAGWATAYGLKSYQEKIEHGWSYDISKVFSPTFVYNSVKLNRMPRAIECNTGMTFYEALNVLQNYGVVPLSDLPYDNRNCSGCLTPNPLTFQNLLNIASNYKISSYQRLLLTDPNEIKYYLSQGMPIIIGAVLEQSFVDGGWYAGRTGSKFIWNANPQSPSIGYHAMVCVGYDDDLREFKVLNSWSQEWGTSGYMFVPYDKFYYFVREAYIAYDAISPALVLAATKTAGAKPTTVNLGEFSNWFKVGYYHEYGGLRIGLGYLNSNKDEIIVKFSDIASDNLIQSILFHLGDTKSFFFKDRKISFTFNKVDKAGNPLSLKGPGVFFTIKFEQETTEPNIKNIIDKFKQDGENLDKSIKQLQQQQQQQQQLKQQIQQQQQQQQQQQIQQQQ